MNRLKYWLMDFMRGRYGMDNLNKMLLNVTLVLIVVNLFLRSRILNLIVVALLIYGYCRMFSRNHNARYRENQKYLEFMNRRGWGRKRAGNMKVSRDRTKRILRCPTCGQKLRVPKGAGKINITCPYCKTSFVKKV